MPSPTSSTPVADRRVLVTGAASGLGLALVRRFAAAGARVLATDVAEAPPEGLLPPGVAYRRLDVRSDADWAAALEDVTARWGGLDLLVNNAGVAAGGRIEHVAMDEWQWIIDINLLGVVRGCRTFVPMFKRQRSGHIVNVASVAGLVHGPGMSAYNAVKAGVVAVSETLSHELAPYDVAVSAVCPAFFRTNLAASMRGSDAGMRASATKLINGSRTSADQVAARVIAGIDRQREVILTDTSGRVMFWTKRLARPLHRRTVRGFATRAARPGAADRAGDARPTADPSRTDRP
jgi:NAD(P)-dependent dehydrogenase (short-subunit alcohol dehydrogenase family)